MDTRRIKVETFPRCGNPLPASDGRVASLGGNPPRRAKAPPTLRSCGCALPPRATPTRSAPHGVALGAPGRQRIQAHPPPSARFEVFLHSPTGMARVVVRCQMQASVAAVDPPKLRSASSFKNSSEFLLSPATQWKRPVLQLSAPESQTLRLVPGVGSSSSACPWASSKSPP